MTGRVALLACLCLLAAAAPAGAVVGGEPLPPEDAPWFAMVRLGCALPAGDVTLDL